MSKWVGIAAIVLLLFISGCAQPQQPTGTTTTETKEPVKVGFLGPLTGGIANIGQNMRAAVELAAEEINAEGGINGRQLQVVFEDGMCDAKEAATAGNKLISVDKVPVIVGEVCSSATLAVAPVAEKAKVVLMSPCSSNPNISNAGDYIFRNYPSDSFQGKFAAELAFEEGKRKVAIMHMLNDYAIGIKDVFINRFKELGGEIGVEESFEQEATDVRTQLTKVKSANPDLIYYIGYTVSTVSGLKQAKELGITAPFLGGDGWDDPKIYEEASEAAEAIRFLAPFAPGTDAFKQAMKKKLGKDEITICAPQAYDIVKIYAQVMRKVGTNSEAIKNELYNVQNYQGVSGTISFDEKGDLKSAVYAIKQVKQGKAEQIGKVGE